MNRILDKIDFVVYIVIAFLIPIYIRVVPFFMVYLLITTLLRKTTYQGIVRLLKNVNFYVLILPFLLMIIGYFYSINKTQAIFSIKVGSSLIIFPFLFYFFKNNQFSGSLHIVCKSFVIGVIVTYAILLINIIPQYIATKDVSLFFYASFSKIIKAPNHLSYNVLFAIIIVLLNLIGANWILLKKNRKMSIILSFVAFIILSIFLFQLVSKSTIIIYFICVITIVIYSYSKKLIKLSSFVSILIVILGISFYMITIPSFQVRFANMYNLVAHKDNINYSEKESSTLRYSAMLASLDLIKENWLIGVGTGDVVDELERLYIEKNYTAAYRAHTNPHNQFLRSFIMSGIFGLLSLLLMFYVIFKTSLKKKNIVGIFWTFIMFSIFFIDDIFIFRDGVVYFSFFTSYFVLDSIDSKSILLNKAAISS